MFLMCTLMFFLVKILKSNYHHVKIWLKLRIYHWVADKMFNNENIRISNRLNLTLVVWTPDNTNKTASSFCIGSCRTLCTRQNFKKVECLKESFFEPTKKHYNGFLLFSSWTTGEKCKMQFSVRDFQESFLAVLNHPRDFLKLSVSV